MKIFGINFSIKKEPELNINNFPLHDNLEKNTFKEDTPSIDYKNLSPYNYSGQYSYSGYEHSIYDGEKFPGSFGDTQIQMFDYWTMRARSTQLFNENLYARGLIRRLITNEINAGLSPEAIPDSRIVNMNEDALEDWTDEVETRFFLWAKNPKVCDWEGKNTFGSIQRKARRAAIISGDVLVVLRHAPSSPLPKVQLISGSRVQTPWATQQKLRNGHKINHGVEFDSMGREVAYWILQDDLSFKRMPRYGEKSGRLISWLYYGTDMLLDNTRGLPLLSIVLYSLKELDRYRDSVQRKAAVNSYIVGFIEKSEDKVGSSIMGNAAMRRSSVKVKDEVGTERKLKVNQYIPGVYFDELQVGEKPHVYNESGAETNYPEFEKAILSAIAWANELPPGILFLSFSQNYSATQGEINEAKMYLDKEASRQGDTFCNPIYEDVLISSVISNKISAPGLLEAWRDPNMQDVYTSWTTAIWYGKVKPSTDIVKVAKAAKIKIDESLTTRARECREITGEKFSRVVKKLKKENQMLAEALRPLMELKSSIEGSGLNNQSIAINNINDDIEDLKSQMEEMLL